MNASFETIRKELKKFNAEENESPPKLVVANFADFLDLEHKQKRNSQFIIAVKEFPKSDEALINKFIADLEIRAGQKPLSFFYDKRDIIEDVIKDFEDYYNRPINQNIFQQLSVSTSSNEHLFCLIIIVSENKYYQS